MSLIAEIQTDPRTGLRIIEIPLDQMKYFADLKGSVIHWFGHVTKYNQKWSTQTRVCIISDRCIYLCHTDGGITRCIQIASIQQVFLSAKTAIGFKVAQPDYDLLIAPANEQQREEIFEIIERIYYSQTGDKLPSRRLVGSGELAEQSMQNFINLKKPENFKLQIEPLGTISALTKKMAVKRQKENEDRKIVEEEFNRVRKGLIAELANYRDVEYKQMQSELERREKLLRERDIEIAHIKETSVSLDDPEVWRKCPNCKALRKMLEAHPSDDKQKVFKLQRDVESQRHIVQHLQAALLHRNGGSTSTAAGGEGGAASTSSHLVGNQALREEVERLRASNKELIQIMLNSSALPSGSAALLAANGAGGLLSSASGSGTGNVSSALLAQKEREIQHLKTVLKEATFRHVQELELLRKQVQQYEVEMKAQMNKMQLGQQQQQQLQHQTSSNNLRPFGLTQQQLQQDAINRNLIGGGARGGELHSSVAHVGSESTMVSRNGGYSTPRSGATATNNGMGGGGVPRGEQHVLNSPRTPSSFLVRSPHEHAGSPYMMQTNSASARGGGLRGNDLASPSSSEYFGMNSVVSSGGAGGGSNASGRQPPPSSRHLQGGVMDQSPSLKLSAQILGI